MLSLDESFQLLGVKSLHKQIIHIFARIAHKERLLVQKGECQSFKTLKKSLHEFLSDHSFCKISFLLVWPIKDIPSIVDLMVLHIFVVAPNSSLDEVNLQLLLSLKLNRKPCIVALQLVQKLKERPFFEDRVTVLVLNVGQQLEEIDILNLRVPKDVLQRVGQCRLHLEQRLQSNLVDFFETFAKMSRKVLDFKLLNQLLVGLRQKQFAKSSIGVDLKDTIIKFPFDEFVDSLFANNVIPVKIVNNGSLVLPL